MTVQSQQLVVRILRPEAEAEEEKLFLEMTKRNSSVNRAKVFEK